MHWEVYPEDVYPHLAQEYAHKIVTQKLTFGRANSELASIISCKWKIHTGKGKERAYTITTLSSTLDNQKEKVRPAQRQ